MDLIRGYAVLLDYRYWLDPNPVPLGPSLVSQILAFFAWFVAAALAVSLFAHATRKRDPLRTDLLKRFVRPLGASGALGLLCLFFAYEQLPIFGMRFWFLLTFLIFSVWMARAAVFAVKEYPLRRAEIAERQRIEKYLSKRK